ncbi:MAG: hypothetical protein HY094_01720 [Candidatus Melainabacteria bacterium]|nr:hypothetical protein [Candidatus Melainabacteria bacterium]
MAILLSEDEQVKSSFKLLFIKDQIANKPSMSWVPYKIFLKSDEKELVFEKKSKNNGAGDYVFALKPINEIENIINGIKVFLESKTNNMFSFEPIEPSFELILERAHKGYSVICWMDAGNVVSDHYTWDGFGVRFFTSEEKIALFVKELESENKIML